MNKTGTPYGDILGLMNPLSKRSFNYSFSSLSSTGAILYGKIDIGSVSGRRLMLKSISLSGGILENFSDLAGTGEHKFDLGVTHWYHWKWHLDDLGDWTELRNSSIDFEDLAEDSL
ncbi:hypothetical protein T459_21377 [Capsicum annuum]|uniref:Uncharacterized protein n=1 Tax=Capsicum annuum TaxID=4072 RepID=A0A2G2YWF5_CAPAN|nr:hypothetical protein T459_21377 [Capsicum annuum]